MYELKFFSETAVNYFELYLDAERLCVACETRCELGWGFQCSSCAAIIHYHCLTSEDLCPDCTEGD